MKPFLLWFFEHNQLFWIVGRNFIGGRWVELVRQGSYKIHANLCLVLLLRRRTPWSGDRSLYEGEGDPRIVHRLILIIGYGSGTLCPLLDMLKMRKKT